MEIYIRGPIYLQNDTWQQKRVSIFDLKYDAAVVFASLLGRNFR